MRICIIYDRIHPLTLGGAERWTTGIAQRLAEQGHQVTYLTMRHWNRSVEPSIPGVRLVTVGPQVEHYSRTRRRIFPPLIFGGAVFAHLLRHGRSYDFVHAVSFPYFSVLAAGVLRALGRYRLRVDWFEVWTREYWREYLGTLGGAVGWLVQLLCIRFTQEAGCFSRLHSRRLRDHGLRAEIQLLGGLYEGGFSRSATASVEPLLVYAGRFIPEKRVPLVVLAFAEARQTLPNLRCEIYGDGPEREEVEGIISARGLESVVQIAGFVDDETVERALGRALCLILPSRREGYGLVVVEAAARGTPSIVVQEPDNAATELIEPGRNGFIVGSASPAALADAICKAYEAGAALRESTAAWFQENARRLSLEASLAQVVQSYQKVPPRIKAESDTSPL